MSWDRRLDLHIDVDAPSNRSLLTSEADSSALNAPPEFISGDKLKVRLHFWRRGSIPGSLESMDPGAASSFRLSGRPQGVPAGSALLFLASAFTQIGSGIWETEIDLATAELADHLLATPPGAKIIVTEIEIRDAADTSRRSIQFPARALPEVFQSGDTTPTPLPQPVGVGAPVNVIHALGQFVLHGTAHTVIEVGDTFELGGVVMTVGVELTGAPYASNSDFLDVLDTYISAQPAGTFPVESFKSAPDQLDFFADGLGSAGNGIELVPSGGLFAGVDYTSTPTAGGVDATAAPPFLRVTSTTLYIRDADAVWKSVPLVTI